MGYRNAQDIFPEGLLKQIQRYVAGETIYIPAGDERKAWGETSGYQRYIREQGLDFPHHQHAIPFPKVLRIDEYSSDVQRISLAEQNRATKDYAVFINQFE